MRHFLFTATLEFFGTPVNRNYVIESELFPTPERQEAYIRAAEVGVTRVFCTPPVEVSFEDFKTYMGL